MGLRSRRLAMAETVPELSASVADGRVWSMCVSAGGVTGTVCSAAVE